MPDWRAAYAENWLDHAAMIIADDGDAISVIVDEHTVRFAQSCGEEAKSEELVVITHAGWKRLKDFADEMLPQFSPEAM